MEKLRLPLTPEIGARDSSLTKNGITKNMMFEKTADGEPTAVKRPGTVLYNLFANTGLGIYFYAGEVFYILDIAGVPTIDRVTI